MKNLKNIPVPQIKFDEEMEKQFLKDAYTESQNNRNNLSFWYPKIKDVFLTPDTLIIPLSIEEFAWFGGDRYSEESISAMGKAMKAKIDEYGFKNPNKVFVKTGTFSNKFHFTDCKVEDLSNIGKNILDIYYTSMLVGAGLSTEIIVREFIESDKDLATIYEGMPLNTEFRVFYDFDNRKVLGTFNYWDIDVMEENLKKKPDLTDYNSFVSQKDRLLASFNENKDDVVAKVESAMKDVDLTGKWSVDIMLANGKMYLIDMATAETSYYYNRIAE